ncbi:hypothetical protein E4T56_gene8994 [Termitomyces sp. T112]|nr:hypothetical protein E4T56_gene8994 [Termitomyces sp. T112]
MPPTAPVAPTALAPPALAPWPSAWQSPGPAMLYPCLTTLHLSPCALCSDPLPLSKVPLPTLPTSSPTPPPSNAGTALQQRALIQRLLLIVPAEITSQESRCLASKGGDALHFSLSCTTRASSLCPPHSGPTFSTNLSPLSGALTLYSSSSCPSPNPAPTPALWQYRLCTTPAKSNTFCALHSTEDKLMNLNRIP